MTRTASKANDLARNARRYLARGCDYQISHYDESTAIVECYNRHGVKLWEGITSLEAGTRVIDAVRDARSNQCLGW